MTDALRQMFLSYHNDARLRVAKGIEPNNVGNLNPAKNMYKLTKEAGDTSPQLEWDCAMEKQAQDAIAACPSSLGSWQNMAQNLMRYMVC
ncbi:hypothetical protein ANCDUO_22055 [Ancylostoma duodenale]|uniref:SCP domain-containing protein n=1 Tax=Ancylostoma duodenale TaxID=51022 RepID=A0A0C2FH56_9BILA|nr:hypothetical protein ANCDUO_22055 [Ancylostoma duodenale]